MALPIVRTALGIVAVAAPGFLTLWLAHAMLGKSMRAMSSQFLAAALGVTGYCFSVRRIEMRLVSELSLIAA